MLMFTEVTIITKFKIDKEEGDSESCSLEFVHKCTSNSKTEAMRKIEVENIMTGYVHYILDSGYYDHIHQVVIPSDNIAAVWWTLKN